jgi:hypothetical protein
MPGIERFFPQLYAFFRRRVTKDGPGDPRTRQKRIKDEIAQRTDDFDSWREWKDFWKRRIKLARNQSK